MKIGILSLNINTDDLNYGAMLHSWAFQNSLKKYFDIDDSEIIDYKTPIINDFEQSKPFISYLKCKRYSSALKILLSGNNYKRRAAKFRSFISRNMKVTAEKYDHLSLENAELDYDCIICESDVIWSPAFFHDQLDSAFFLAMKSMNDKKKIIYSASMGNADFSERALRDLKKFIKFPDYISCRESYAKEFIEKNTGREAAHVLDPVLLLQKSDYGKILAQENKKSQKKYLLLYIPVGYNSEYQNCARNYAASKGLEVIELSYFTFNRIKNKVVADAGIDEFLSLINNAEVIFTNSFHAVCFSILFHKDFYAFSRTTGRKTEDICNLFQLSDRYMNVREFKEMDKIDYCKIDEILEKYRRYSLKWLENSIKK